MSGRKVGKSAREEYRVERVFVGDRTAEQVVADLIRVHSDGSAQQGEKDPFRR